MVEFGVIPTTLFLEKAIQTWFVERSKKAKTRRPTVGVCPLPVDTAAVFVRHGNVTGLFLSRPHCCFGVV